MRTRGEPVLLAIVSVAVLAVAATALAKPVSSLSAGVSPAKPGTKQHPKNVELDLAVSHETDVAGEALQPTIRLAFDLPSQFIFGGYRFASCKPYGVQSGQCSSKARVGGGRATFQVAAPGGALAQPVDVTAYNGPKGKSVLLHLQSDTPLEVNEVLEGKFNKAGKPYGLTLVFTFPTELQSAAMADLRFELEAIRTVRRDGERRKIPYVGLGPCGDKSLDFKTVTTFLNTSGPAIAEDTVKCGR